LPLLARDKQKRNLNGINSMESALWRSFTIKDTAQMSPHPAPGHAVNLNWRPGAQLFAHSRPPKAFTAISTSIPQFQSSPVILAYDSTLQ